MSAAEGIDDVLTSAQQVVGLIAARGRGDVEGARRLAATLVEDGDLAGGALLVAELAVGLLARCGDEPLERTTERLALELMALPRPAS